MLLRRNVFSSKDGKRYYTVKYIKRKGSQFLVEAETLSFCTSKEITTNKDGHGWMDVLKMWQRLKVVSIFLKEEVRRAKKHRSKEKTTPEPIKRKGISKIIRRSKGNKDKRSRFKHQRGKKDLMIRTRESDITARR